MGWYGSYHSGSSLEQGVILFDFPLPNLDSIKQPVDGQETEYEFNPYNVIVLTQTCDLTNKKVDRVYLCPVYTLDDYFKANPQYAENQQTIRKEYEKLKQGQYVNKFLLNECGSSLSKSTNFYGKYLVVFFDKAVIVSADYVDTFLKKSRRKRFIAVNPPYRESLAQHYGRYFMRVGNPIDYPRREDIDAAKFAQSQQRSPN